MVTAVDTLRQRNYKNGFIYEFIGERGYPVWDEGSAFYSKGHPVLLIPVVRPAEQRVTGLTYISVENSQPIYRWVPRGTDFKIPGLPDKEALETLLLGYEKKVFGAKQDSEISVQVKQEARTIKSDDVPTTNEMWVKVTYTICAGVDAGANGDTTWECDTYSEWMYLSSGGGGSSGGTGGDDGGSGGGSGGFGGDDGSGDGDCSNKAKVPVDGCEEDPPEDETKTLQELLQENEYLLLDVPCEEIPKWAGLAQHETPKDVINRLEQTNSLSGSSIQKLEDASGALVNMDKFSVTVPGNEIPNNWSAEEYLNHIRTNINSYVDGSTFEFYPGLNGEAEKWNNDPLGKLFSIQFIENAPWLDDGSVVTSGYNSSNWTFTTLYTPEDYWHPVSGNRKFGFTNNGNGTYTFYTRGVDRLSTQVDQWVQSLFGIPFSQADALWSSFQNLIAEDFQNATIHNPVKYRPDYDKVSSVLNGAADSSTLGCN